MSIERPPEPPFPLEIERKSLFPLIERSEMETIKQAGSSLDVLSALVDVHIRYNFGFRQPVRNHLRKMIVITRELLVPEQDMSPTSPYRSMLGIEYSEFSGFKEDLSNMTEPWRAALHDVIAYIDNPDEGKTQDENHRD